MSYELRVMTICGVWTEGDDQIICRAGVWAKRVTIFFRWVWAEGDVHIICWAGVWAENDNLFWLVGVWAEHDDHLFCWAGVWTEGDDNLFW
jgi:hypothetical protein